LGGERKREVGKGIGNILGEIRSKRVLGPLYGEDEGGEKRKKKKGNDEARQASDTSREGVMNRPEREKGEKGERRRHSCERRHTILGQITRGKTISLKIIGGEKKRGDGKRE